ncbi:hypothetical protein CDAR_598301 [Caerostris darwini]|uniref:Uncharacterized protein n=1 Tax=Caerostris darwini TaxID=1538125 RepID=A0AAV4QPX4_9ARAC|nr:hypothetical protein CDAR_598301 [Caerostris darwini]
MNRMDYVLIVKEVVRNSNLNPAKLKRHLEWNHPYVWRANPKTAKTSTGSEVDDYSDTISLSQKSGATKAVSMTTGCPKYLSQITF